MLKSLIQSNYIYTYALIDYTEGEILSIASNKKGAALQQLYRRLDSLARSYRADNVSYHMAIFNAVTEIKIVEIKE